MLRTEESELDGEFVSTVRFIVREEARVQIMYYLRIRR